MSRIIRRSGDAEPNCGVNPTRPSVAAKDSNGMESIIRGMILQGFAMLGYPMIQ